MDPTMADPELPAAALFRPSKKRKIYRQRALDDLPDPTSPPSAPAQPSGPPAATAVTEGAPPEDEEVEGARVSMSEILRLRKLRRQRVGGVEFRAESKSGRDENSQEGALVLHEDGRPDDGKERVQSEVGVVRRFAKQTGMVGDVDKHMMAYIDSELAKRRLNTISPAVADTDADVTYDTPEQNSSSGSITKTTKAVEREPAALGKLLEIDLGNEARDRNVARTEQARRRLDGEDIEEESAPEGTNKKVRLGKDGKPWRGRKTRTEEDVRRDKLVEEVLRENRLDIYEEPQPPALSAQGDGEADDRIAEAFRREFMDAVSARQRKKPVPAPPTRGPGGKKDEEVLKGPKLGGSRSARAAMREAQLKELKAGKK